MRRAFYTRATQLADPDFARIPFAELTSKAYADKLAASIGEQATPSQELAPFKIQTGRGRSHDPSLHDRPGRQRRGADVHARRFLWGKCVVAGAGFLLNNEMGDFNLIPGRTDTTGRIGIPGQPDCAPKRMLSSQTPTLLLKDGRYGSSRARRADGPSPIRRSGSCSTSSSSG